MAFFEHGEVFLGGGLLGRIAPQESIRWAVGMNAMLTTEDLERRRTDAQPLGLIEVVGQLRVGPIGAIQPTGGWPINHPLPQNGRQVCREFGRRALGLAGTEASKATIQVGVEPALHRALRRAGVVRNRRVPSAAVRHQDNLDAVAEFRISCRPEDLFQPLVLNVRQMKANHDLVLSYVI
jgi:hypothetical protein